MSVGRRGSENRSGVRAVLETACRRSVQPPAVTSKRACQAALVSLAAPLPGLKRRSAVFAVRRSSRGAPGRAQHSRRSDGPAPLECHSAAWPASRTDEPAHDGPAGESFQFRLIATGRNSRRLARPGRYPAKKQFGIARLCRFRDCRTRVYNAWRAVVSLGFSLIREGGGDCSSGLFSLVSWSPYLDGNDSTMLAVSTFRRCFW